jgi:hypothetical protein
VKNALLISFMVLWSSLAVATDAKLYIFDGKDPYAPAVLSAEPSAAECCTLRAPEMDPKDSGAPSIDRTPKQVELSHQKKRHQFRTIRVSGVRRSPRVDFAVPVVRAPRLERNAHMEFKDEPFDLNRVDEY